jgi:hypothetical protein
MSKELYRIGDLVEHTISYNNNIYAKVINIVDVEGDVSYYEYDVITGCGDMNSKILIIIKPIAYSDDLSNCDLDILSLDPHKVYKKDINLIRTNIKNEIEFLEKKLQFINKNENRIDKLDKILG